MREDINTRENYFKCDPIESVLLWPIVNSKIDAYEFFCFCSVVVFPVISIFYESLPIIIPKFVNIIDKKTNITDESLTSRANFITFAGDVTSAYITGIVLAGFFLYWIGRKYTVVIGHVLNIGSLLYSYKLDLDKHRVPYALLIVLLGLDDFCFVAYFMYLAEMTSTTFRPLFMALFFSIKVYFEEIMSAARDGHGLNRMMLICTVVTSSCLLITLISPETPFWMALKGNPEKAEETFTWLRAGTGGTVEFNQLLARAESMIENSGITPHILSRTFVVGLMFSTFVVLCGFNPCVVFEPFLNDFHYADHILKRDEWWNFYHVITASQGLDLRHRNYGAFIFLSFSFVVPRKIMYFVSYAFSALIVLVIWLKIGPWSLLITMSSFCNLAPFLGVEQLSMILPVEVFPAPLREVGVTVTAILIRAFKYYYTYSSVPSRINFPKPHVIRAMSYITFFGSFVGIAFILLFMPETSNMNIYQLDELNIRLPFKRKKHLPSEGEENEAAAVEGEGAAVEGESAAVEGEGAAVEGEDAEGAAESEGEDK